jgi:hypothetical protein
MVMQHWRPAPRRMDITRERYGAQRTRIGGTDPQLRQ